MLIVACQKWGNEKLSTHPIDELLKLLCPYQCEGWKLADEGAWFVKLENGDEGNLSHFGNSSVLTLLEFITAFTMNWVGWQLQRRSTTAWMDTVVDILLEKPSCCIRKNASYGNLRKYGIEQPALIRKSWYNSHHTWLAAALYVKQILIC